ncbi:uncharacterized protein RMCFA_2693, partial [Mycolicibacterium fortuitum subsp. acetamidolyticum]
PTPTSTAADRRCQPARQSVVRHQHRHQRTGTSRQRTDYRDHPVGQPAVRRCHPRPRAKRAPAPGVQHARRAHQDSVHRRRGPRDGHQDPSPGNARGRPVHAHTQRRDL